MHVSVCVCVCDDADGVTVWLCIYVGCDSLLRLILKCVMCMCGHTHIHNLLFFSFA